MCAFFLSESSRKTRWQNAGRKTVFEAGFKNAVGFSENHRNSVGSVGSIF
jgi:hypothetical protein